jgi:hypothetical protein
LSRVRGARFALAQEPILALAFGDRDFGFEPDDIRISAVVLAFEQAETVFHALDSVGPGVGDRGALAGGRIKRDRQAVGQLLAVLQQLQLAFPS